MAIQKVIDQIKLIQTAGDTYQGTDLDQIYMVSPAAIGAGDTITIIDQGGVNKIQFLDGLVITNATVVADETQLTLSNGAIINVRGADTFTFNVGGNTITGTDGVDMTFAEFAQNVLNVALPAEGEAAVTVTGTVEMNADGTTSNTTGDMNSGLSVTVTTPTAQEENTEVTTGTVIATVTIEADTTYALSGDDAGMFALNATTGEITATAAYTPDFETDPSYAFTVTATAADGTEATKDVTVEVDNVDELDSPIVLTIKADDISVDGHFTDKDTVNEAEIEGTDTRSVKTSVADDTINAPMLIEGGTKKNTLNTTDSIVDPSNTDHDKLDAELADDLGTSGNVGTNEDGPTITDIEDITLHGTQNVNAYSLKNVTSTAEDNAATTDVNEGATISVNIDHGGIEKFTSSTDIDLSVAVSNVDGNDIKEVNLIEDTKSMAVSEISNNPAINLTNGEINTLTLDALDNAKLATEDVTVNLLNDKDGKLTLGLYDDNDDLAAALAANPVDTDDVANARAGHDGGGFKNLTLVTSDVAMNVTLAEGTHLRNDDTIDTEVNGFGIPAVDVGVGSGTTAGGSEADNGQTLTPAGGQDNLTDQLNLAGTKDITITGTDRQLDQAKIRDTLTDDATSTLALGITADSHEINLTEAEVDLVKVDASVLTINQTAMVAVDNGTTVEVNKIGDNAVLTITGDAERTDDLDIIINTNRNDANNGRLVLGGDDLSQSETATSGSKGDSTEAGSAFPATTQGVDANNAALHVNKTDSVLDRLDISALLGVVTIDGDKDLNIEDGGLIFDDTTVKFNNPNVFAANTAPGNVDAEGETGVGFGGDWVNATAMTGDLNIILRDNQPSDTMDNEDNGIRIDFGSGDDRITGLGTAASGTFGTLAGDNIDMGAGDDTVIIGINDSTTNSLLNVPSVGSFQSLYQQAFNALEEGDDKSVTAQEESINFTNVIAAAIPDIDIDQDGALTSAGDVDNSAIRTAAAAAITDVYQPINAEVYLGEGSDTVIFRNQNSGFLAGDNGVRIKDFEAGNNGDKMGFQMFQDGAEDGMPGLGKLHIDNQVIQQDLNLFNNGQVIADSDTGPAGKYIINGYDGNGNGLNDSAGQIPDPDDVADNIAKVAANAAGGGSSDFSIIISGGEAFSNGGDEPTHNDIPAATMIDVSPALYNLYTPAVSLMAGAGVIDGDDTGANDGNVVLISTADIHKFTNTSAQNLWASNDGGLTPVSAGNGAGVFKEVTNVSITTLNDGHQYETIVLVGEATGTDGVKIFYVTDETAPDTAGAAAGLHNLDGAPTASLVGFLEGININDLEQDNFDFI